MADSGQSEAERLAANRQQAYTRLPSLNPSGTQRLESLHSIYMQRPRGLRSLRWTRMHEVDWLVHGEQAEGPKSARSAVTLNA